MWEGVLSTSPHHLDVLVAMQRQGDVFIVSDIFFLTKGDTHFDIGVVVM